MKPTLIKSLVLVVLFLSTSMLSAQKAEEPDHSYDIGGKIDYMTLTSAGVLLVAHGDGLAGIKPGHNEIIFNFDDYGKVKQEELFIVPRTPYVMVGQTGFGGVSTKQSVIDFVSGKRIFDTRANGWKAAGRPTLIMPENKLIVAGQRTAKEKYTQAIGIYNMETGEEEKLFSLKGSNTLTGSPRIINGGIILPTAKGLYRLDAESGNESWMLELKNVAHVYEAEDEKSIYVAIVKGKNHQIHKVSENGTELWTEGKKLKGKVSNFQITKEGLALVSDVADSGKKGLGKLASAKAQSNISFLSASTGEDLWEKAPKTKGYVQHFYIMDDGILFGIQSGGINKVSFDGLPLFKKPLKTGENIHTMALTKQGIIYITDEDADIIDLNTGESIWPKPIKYKRAKAVASVYDETHGRYLISTGKEMIAINENSGDINTLSTYEFDEKENPTSIEVRKGGLLLSSDQNMMMLDFDGSQKFHEYFRSPGKSAFAIVALSALALTSTAMMADASFQAGANRNAIGQYNSYGAQKQREADGYAAIATASFVEMSKRFSATAATENAQFILTKLDEGVGLIKINKDSGMPEKEVVLKDKKPDYEVDELGGYLYYKANNSTIYSYNLNN